MLIVLSDRASTVVESSCFFVILLGRWVDSRTVVCLVDLIIRVGRVLGINRLDEAAEIRTTL